MSIASIGSPLPISALIEPQPQSGARADRPSPEDSRKAAAQFEAILVRQLLGPTMSAILSSGSGESGGPGSDVYGYMLTDVFANSLSAGRGMGLSNIIELQLGVPASTESPAAS